MLCFVGVSDVEFVYYNSYYPRSQCLGQERKNLLRLYLCCIAVIHIQPYTHTCRNKINNNDEWRHFFRKLYLSHFIRNGCERVTKGLCVRGELETEQTATYWPPVPSSLSTLLSRSVGLLNRGSWEPIALC